jgi:hypothetical protein
VFFISSNNSDDSIFNKITIPNYFFERYDLNKYLDNLLIENYDIILSDLINALTTNANGEYI